MSTNNEQPRTAAELGAALKPKQRLFADAFLSNGLNAYAACKTAKYTDPRGESGRLPRHPEIAAYIRARLDEWGFSVAEIRQRLEYLAGGDMRDFLQVAPSERSYWVRAEQAEQIQEAAKRRGVTPDALDNYDISGIMGAENVALTEDGVLMVCVKQVDAEVTVNWREAEKAQALGRIKKIKIGKDGAVEFELHDPVKTLELLGKAQAMFTDKQQISGGDGGPVQIEITRRVVRPDQ